MRIAYLDCATGISGDMTLGALLDAGVDAGAIHAAIDSLKLPGVRLVINTVMREGFRATHVQVEHPEQHAHRNLESITRIVDGAAALTEPQRLLAKRIFTAIAEAEAKVHGSTLNEVHFHEVGAIDSIVDVVGAAVGFDLLGAQEVVCSAVPTGRGKVRIAHGVCSIPTPGTAELLKGIPLVDVPVDAELTTPTGAAILKSVVGRFGALPAMRIEAIGYGAGTRELPGRANVLRLFVGNCEATAERDQVYVLETNLDDLSGEVIGYTRQKLLLAGALDVFTTAVQMKKDRPGTLLSVICRPADREALEHIVFVETGTFGIRRQLLERSTRNRKELTVSTPWGLVRGKLGWRTGGDQIFTPEYEACRHIAAERGVPLREVFHAAERAFEALPAEQRTPPAGAEPSTAPHSSEPPAHDHDRAHDHDHRHDHDHDHRHDHDHDHDGHRHDHDH